jgi:dipeptidyl aminopeptidase/acylaminoacyl peptidase
VFAQTGVNGLRQISAEGGDATFITTVEQSRDELGHAWPEFLPDGRSVLFTVARSADGPTSRDIALLDLATGTWSVLIRGGSHAKYLPTGHLIYGTGDSLRAVRFDSERKTVVGTATPVVSPVGSTDVGGYEYDVSNDGTLVYRTSASSAVSPARTLVWVDRRGRETPLGAPARPYIHPRLAPDGTRVVVFSADEQRDLWIWDLAGKRLTRATFDPANETVSLWSPDGQHLLFASNRAGGPANLFIQAANGIGTPRG